MSDLFRDMLGSGPTCKSLVETLAACPSVQSHGLTDGDFSLAYGDLTRALDGIESRLYKARLEPPACVAFECSQSVGGAAALLFLLSRGYDFVLLPQLAEQSKESKTPRFIPNFCSHIVSSWRAPAGDEKSLTVEVNPEFRPLRPGDASPGPDLYLRTSGSTSVPKLVRMSHQKWLDNARGCVRRWRLTSADRLAVAVTIFHSYGFGAAFLPGLLAGAAMDLLAGFNILRYLDREAKFSPNVALLTPAVCEMFLRVRKSPYAYRLAVTAGEKVKEDTVVRFESRFGPLLDLYGSAEMGAVSSAAPDDPLELRRGTAGYALPGIELRLATQPERGGPGETPPEGLLCCRQQLGFAGYLSARGSEWLFEPRSDESWFSTGDLARIRGDGYLEVLGRSGLSVKRDGLLVVFAEVETAMLGLHGLARVAVFSRGQSRRGPRLIAVCEPGPQGAAGAAELRRRCFEALPAYAVPDEVAVVDALPLLPNGKIDRRALPDLL